MCVCVAGCADTLACAFLWEYSFKSSLHDAMMICLRLQVSHQRPSVTSLWDRPTSSDGRVFPIVFLFQIRGDLRQRFNYFSV